MASQAIQNQEVFEAGTSRRIEEGVAKEVAVTQHNSALWSTVYGRTARKSSTIATVSHGDYLQSLTALKEDERLRIEGVHIDDSPHWEPEETLVRAFWKVVTVFSVRNRKHFDGENEGNVIYTLVRPCLFREDELTLQPTERANIVIRLTENVRRVMVIQKASDGDARSTFKVYGRREGYPPQIG